MLRHGAPGLSDGSGSNSVDEADDWRHRASVVTVGGGLDPDPACLFCIAVADGLGEFVYEGAECCGGRFSLCRAVDALRLLGGD